MNNILIWIGVATVAFFLICGIWGCRRCRSRKCRDCRT